MFKVEIILEDEVIVREFHKANDMCDCALKARMYYINQDQKVTIKCLGPDGFLLAQIESYNEINFNP